MVNGGAKDYYFYFHHTNADTADKLNPRDMDMCVAAMAVMSYCVADAKDTLPRSPPSA